MVNGPYGGWKYIGNYGRFYRKIDKKYLSFQKIFIIGERKKFTSFATFQYNELKQLNHDTDKSIDLRILYIVEDYEEILFLEMFKVINESKLGRIRFITKNPSLSTQIGEQFKNMVILGDINEEIIQELAPQPNQDVLVLLHVYKKNKLFVEDCQRNMGYAESQIINFSSLFG